MNRITMPIWPFSEPLRKVSGPIIGSLGICRKLMGSCQKMFCKSLGMFVGFNDKPGFFKTFLGQMLFQLVHQ
jgi:hypothetical protein